MRIVFCPTSFVPRIGGIENLTEMTADALGRMGDEVTVLTQEPGPPMPGRGYRLVRRPSLSAVVKACRGADAVVMPNIGLTLIPGVLISRAPLFVWHQHEFRDMAKPLRHHPIPTQLKGLIIAHYARANLGCSDYITDLMPITRPRATLLNPYDPSLFFQDPATERTKDIVALGRLVPEKGFSLAIEALALAGGPLGAARLSVIGAGVEKIALEALAARLGVSDRVTFLGARTGADLRTELAAHKVLVVPSIWHEPFGIVALEGLAAGCNLAVSKMGGLPQAVGAFGKIFDPRDLSDVARAIAEALAEPIGQDSAARAEHLASHTADAIARRLKALVSEFG